MPETKPFPSLLAQLHIYPIGCSPCIVDPAASGSHTSFRLGILERKPRGVEFREGGSTALPVKCSSILSNRLLRRVESYKYQLLSNDRSRHCKSTGSRPAETDGFLLLYLQELYLLGIVTKFSDLQWRCWPLIGQLTCMLHLIPIYSWLVELKELCSLGKGTSKGFAPAAQPTNCNFT